MKARKSFLKALPLLSICCLSNVALAETQILKASTIITMNERSPRAEAVAFDTVSKKITAVGSFADVQAQSPQAKITDLGSTVLMPGFVEPHSHPLLGGMVTQSPAYWVAPYVGYKTWDDVKAKILKEDAAMPARTPLIFNGVDRLLQQAPTPTNKILDALTPSGRPILLLDNSGHAVYFNTAVIKGLPWANGKPPKNPVGGSFGRNADGTSNGVANEVPALMVVVAPLLGKAIPHPLLSGAKWYAYMASFGITSTSDMTYSSGEYKAYLALASLPDSPLRINVYHMSTEPDAAKQVTWPDPGMVRKQGIKLWADGTPWLGTVAQSFGYLDNQTTKRAQIILGPLGEKGMNYTRLQLDQILDQFAPLGYQMSFHCNGDVGFDVVMDAYERALNKYKLIGTDHRWRVEHLGAAQGDQFKRAASLGVTVSMSPFQYIYWGDLLDGTMFESSYGSQWEPLGDAFKSDVKPSFHNDGPVSPPNPLLNIQSMVTRTTISGKVHGANQAVSMNDALKAVTVNGAYQLKRDKEVGSLEVGKYADFVELSGDLTAVKPIEITEKVKVQGTWVGGKKIDLTKFINEVTAMDPSSHQDLAKSSLSTWHGHMR
ncbi:amidohydrolase [Polynucleobacter sp. CS-Odin-A6]|uniref:amidohydrolase n=1 Tax=Polynucleobacter sp. CS-Odin-A6 TaxID=2689106 RepID=UPI001C0E15CA|nr:amidohydrolase [Polynucleobacter sp. CS-Odin-A6]MBU3621554.1 amidohydrolase [Polynucleobacter sp. CS-Odin-A6]